MKEYKFRQQVTINGVKKTFRADTKRELTRKIAEFTEKSNKAPLFQEVADEWRGQHFETLAYNSLKPYKAAFARCVERFGEMRIDELTPIMVQNYLRWLADAGYAMKTVSNARCVLNQICDHAVVHGHILYNPCASVKIPKGLPKTSRKPPTDAELQEVIRTVEEDRFGELPFVLLFTGLRIGEALALTRDDVDFARGVIHVRKSVFWADGDVPTVKCTKTESGDRDIPILSPILPILARRRSKYLFGDKMPVKWYAFRDQWEAWQKRHGVKASPHQFRHAYASLCKDAGLTPKDTQVLIGHADIKTTMNTYTHLSEAALDANRERLEKQIVAVKSRHQVDTRAENAVI